FVRGFLQQGVLERVERIGRSALRQNELGLGQPVEGVLQGGSVLVHDRGDDFVRKTAADRGADLRHVLDRGQPVEPFAQRIFQRRRNRQRRRDAFAAGQVRLQ